MKIARFLSVLLMSILLALAWAHKSEAKTLLTYDQFLNLSDREKKSYIEMVQILARDLSRSRHLVTQEEFESRRLYLEQILLHFIPKAQASDSSSVDSVCMMDSAKAKALSNDDLLSSFSGTLNCVEDRATRKDPVYFRPVAIQRVEVLTGEFLSRVEANTLNSKTKHFSEGIGALQAAISEVKTKGTRSGTPSSMWLSSEYKQLGTMDGYSFRENVKVKDMSKGIQAEGSGSGGSSSNAASNTSATNGSATATAQTPAAEKAATDNSATAAASSEAKELMVVNQCLYAGFVIPKNSGSNCQPYKVLPFDSSMFDKKTFVCPESAQILCNPLLFGYEETHCKTTPTKSCEGKRPLCIYRSVDATKNCFELAKKKKTLNLTLELWKSPEGEKLYKAYVESLEELCDANRLEKRNLKPAIHADITKTCEVAFSVLKENIKNEFQPASLLTPKSNSNSIGSQK